MRTAAAASACPAVVDGALTFAFEADPPGGND